MHVSSPGRTPQCQSQSGVGVTAQHNLSGGEELRGVLERPTEAAQGSMGHLERRGGELGLCASDTRLTHTLSLHAGPPHLDPGEDSRGGDAEVQVGNELRGGDLVVAVKFLPRSVVGVENGREGLGVNKSGCLLQVGGAGWGGEGKAHAHMRVCQEARFGCAHVSM